jgi:hypothetical protein
MLSHSPVRLVTSAVVLAAALLFTAAPASAQTGVGVRAGVSGNPDQFFMGAHVDTPPIIERLTFRPNVEIGFGDNATLVALNVEFAYWLPIENSPWQLYFGGGPAANLYKFDVGSDSDTEMRGGLNILVGVQHARGLFTELKVGAIDSPDIKFAVGYVFRR